MTHDMNSKERVIRTITFDHPDRIPVDLWYFPGTVARHGKAFQDLLTKYPSDITDIDYKNPFHGYKQLYKKGTFTDVWKITWVNIKEGIMGQPKRHPLQNWSALRNYRMPSHLINEGWEEVDASLHRNQDRFVTAPRVSVFERMQFLRGTENLLMDLAEEPAELYILRDMLFEYNAKFLQKVVSYSGIDAVVFGDDWGSQQSLLISPGMWRKFFKPIYQGLFDIARSAGKYIFFHSDGYIMDIYDDLIELGVKAINSQVRCMGVEKLGRRFAGKVTFWGEISRQHTLPWGTPEQVKSAAKLMRQQFCVKGGGLIGAGEAGPDVPLANIEMLLRAWNASKGVKHG